MKVVLDTNVLICSLLFDGSVGQKLLVRLALAQIPIYCSAGMLVELQNIVGKKHVLKKKIEESRKNIPYILGQLTLLAVIINPKEKVRICRDEKDNKIIECALASSSDYLVTFDKDLLVLGKYENIEIVHPLKILKLLDDCAQQK